MQTYKMAKPLNITTVKDGGFSMRNKNSGLNTEYKQ